METFLLFRFFFFCLVGKKSGFEVGNIICGDISRHNQFVHLHDKASPGVNGNSA